MGVTVFPEAGFLPGMVMPYAGSIAPGGWLLADGSLLNRADYTALFAVIGTQYNTGGELATQFRLPNLKGKVIAGLDTGQVEFDTLGESGGAKTVALVEANLGSHAHSVSVVDNNFSTGNDSPDHSHYVNGNNFDTWWVSSDHTHAMQHWHLGWTASFMWNGTQTHGHHDRGGTASEAPWEGANWTGGTTVNVDGTAQAAPGGTNTTGGISANHRHNANHDHSSAGRSVFHQHTANHGHSASSGNAGSGTAHNNLQPYLTMNYLIKV